MTERARATAPPAPNAKKIHSKSLPAANFDEEEIECAPSHLAPAVAKKTQSDSLLSELSDDDNDNNSFPLSAPKSVKQITRFLAIPPSVLPAASDDLDPHIEGEDIPAAAPKKIRKTRKRFDAPHDATKRNPPRTNQGMVFRRLRPSFVHSAFARQTRLILIGACFLCRIRLCFIILVLI